MINGSPLCTSLFDVLTFEMLLNELATVFGNNCISYILLSYLGQLNMKYAQNKLFISLCTERSVVLSQCIYFSEAAKTN